MSDIRSWASRLKKRQMHPGKKTFNMKIRRNSKEGKKVEIRIPSNTATKLCWDENTFVDFSTSGIRMTVFFDETKHGWKLSKDESGKVHFQFQYHENQPFLMEPAQSAEVPVGELQVGDDGDFLAFNIPKEIRGEDQT